MDLQYGMLTLKNLDKAVLDKWYAFTQAKDRKDDLLEIVKLRIDLSGDFLISDDYKHFKRIERKPPKEQKKEYTGEITFKIEYLSPLIQLPYDHLPDPKFRNLTKKEREHYQARRTDV